MALVQGMEKNKEMSYYLGNRAKSKLSTCHKDLQLIAEESLKVSQVDFGVSEGHRNLEKQMEYFNSGRSKIDGIKVKGKHNYQPSMAFDIYAYVKGKPKLAFNKTYLVYLMGVITATAKRLLHEGKISTVIRSGFNWDCVGEIGTDQRFQDLHHFLLKD